MGSAQRRIRALSCVLWFVSIGAVLAPSVAAQNDQQVALRTGSGSTVERRILVLRPDDKARSSAEAPIDRAIGQVLAEMGFIVNVSAMPFRDAQLALGCQGTVRKCGASVASALENEQLGVTSVEHADASRASLWLYLFAPGIEREGSAEIPLESSSDLLAAVRELARTVYGDAAPEPRSAARRAKAPRTKVTPPQPVVVAAMAEPALVSVAQPAPDAPESRGSHALPAVGWSSASIGGALLLSGIVTSLASRKSSDDYAGREIRSRDDADAALASYERAEHQASASRALLGTGGVLLASGAVMLLWDRLWWRHQDRKLQFSALPAAHGAALSLAGSFEGRSW